MDPKRPLGTVVGLDLRDIVFDVDPATLREKGTPTLIQFLAYVYCGQMAGWMKTPLGTEVDLGPSHIVGLLDGVPDPAKGEQQPPLLLSCCYVIFGYRMHGFSIPEKLLGFDFTAFFTR